MRATLLEAATSTGAGTTALPRATGVPKPNGLIQVILNSGTSASVDIEGSLDNTNWTTIYSVDLASGGVESDLREVYLPPYIRGNVTAISGASVTANLSH